ncbi:hypothetical protein [Roseimaritima ulvae]|uniref:Uncharacterized protein n=2 Tax=Roseimaritima ulvae TaxID=980254 RepID=A0A5B9R2E4_9BACT|nr:hypothetical protein [Roseimaritima ulvae]QEG40421.1 hypothetical protein UC8_24330 [Roseimaritima ulvae]
MREQRLTIVSQITLQVGRHAAETIETRQGDAALVGEEPYRRTLMIGSEFVPIESGWVQQPGRLIVKNTEPKRDVVATSAQPLLWIGTAAKTHVFALGAGEQLAVHWRGEPIGLSCEGATSVEALVIVAERGRAPE